MRRKLIENIGRKEAEFWVSGCRARGSLMCPHTAYYGRLAGSCNLKMERQKQPEVAGSRGPKREPQQATWPVQRQSLKHVLGPWNYSYGVLESEDEGGIGKSAEKCHSAILRFCPGTTRLFLWSHSCSRLQLLSATCCAYILSLPPPPQDKILLYSPG